MCRREGRQTGEQPAAAAGENWHLSQEVALRSLQKCSGVTTETGGKW